MSSYSRWPLEPGGHVDASNQIQQTRTNQAASDNSNRARERQHCGFPTNRFTIPLPSRRRNAPAASGLCILAGCVPEASLGMDGAPPPGRQDCLNPINAFLTLTAVTEW